MSQGQIAPRAGIACAGTWIVDHVKIVDVLPKPGNLANILNEEKGTGGCPFNALIDLARLEPALRLEAVGLVGDDDDGRWISDQIRPYAADASQLRVRPGAPTSYTDVMTVQATGQRTFFHMRGANEAFDVDDVNVAALRSRVFHLGYLLLLTALDGPDPEFGTRAARLLARCREAGMKTSIDCVSAEGGRFAEIVRPALKQTDYCIVNEVEAGGVAGLAVRGEAGEPLWNAIREACQRIAGFGVARCVTIHLPEGAASLDVQTDSYHQVASLKLPPGFIKGTAGAGDAFCAGMLLGLHEGWPLGRAMRVGHAAAAASMRHPTCTQGMGSMAEVEALAAQFGAA